MCLNRCPYDNDYCREDHPCGSCLEDKISDAEMVQYESGGRIDSPEVEKLAE